MFARVEKFVFFGKYHYLADVTPPRQGTGGELEFIAGLTERLKKIAYRKRRYSL